MRPISQMADDISLAAELFDRATAQAVDSILALGEVNARRLVDGPLLKRRTGALHRSIHRDIQPGRGETTGQLIAGGRGVTYARIHEVGGVIEGQPWLVFQVADGSFRKVRRVTVRAKRYLQRGLEDAMQSLGDELTREFAPLLSLEARR